MTQIPSHSQTPEFGHIPPIGILYQHPPSSAQIAKANRWNKLKAFMHNVIAVAVFSSPILATPFAIHSCSDDADRRAVEVVKFQMEVGK